MKKGPKQPDLNLGPLPVHILNARLGYELRPGNVVFSRGAQSHAARRHPGDYSLFQPHLAAVIANPMYVGDDFKNPGNVELIGRVHAANSFLLVAIHVTRDSDGRYAVRSFYPVNEAKIQIRKEKGYLKIT